MLQLLTHFFMMDQESFYDSFAPWYDIYCESQSLKKLLNEEIKILASLHPKKILELGMGTGRFAREYLNRYPKTTYIGIDSSIQMLSYAKDLSCICIHAYMEDYVAYAKTTNTVFDCVVIPYTALHHVQEKDQHKLFINIASIAQFCIITILTEEEEGKLFATKAGEVNLDLKENKLITKVHRIHKKIRKSGERIFLEDGREILLYQYAKR